MRGGNVLWLGGGWLWTCSRGDLRFRGDEGDGPSVIAESRHDRDGSAECDFGGTVALGISSRRNQFAGESQRGRSGRSEWFVRERHAQFAGFSGDGGIDRGSELEDEMRGIVRGSRGSEVGSDGTDKESAGLLVQNRRPPQKARQDEIERSKRDEAAPIFKNEFCLLYTSRCV